MIHASKGAYASQAETETEDDGGGGGGDGDDDEGDGEGDGGDEGDGDDSGSSGTGDETNGTEVKLASPCAQRAAQGQRVKRERVHSSLCDVRATRIL
jgi:hypothetical protein